MPRNITLGAHAGRLGLGSGALDHHRWRTFVAFDISTEKYVYSTFQEHVVASEIIKRHGPQNRGEII